MQATGCRWRATRIEPRFCYCATVILCATREHPPTACNGTLLSCAGSAAACSRRKQWTRIRRDFWLAFYKLMRDALHAHATPTRDADWFTQGSCSQRAGCAARACVRGCVRECGHASSMHAACPQIPDESAGEREKRKARPTQLVAIFSPVLLTFYLRMACTLCQFASLQVCRYATLLISIWLNAILSMLCLWMVNGINL